MKNWFRLFGRGASKEPQQKTIRITADGDAEILEVHLSRVSEDLETPSPSTVYTTWKNVGAVPIRLLIGDVIAYNAAGEMVFQITGSTLYQSEGSAPGIAPGETHIGKEDWTLVIEGMGGAPGPIVKADVTITGAFSMAGIA